MQGVRRSGRPGLDDLDREEPGGQARASNGKAAASTLSATSPENGTAIEEIEVRYLAEPIEIGFNSRYLLDITEQIEGEGAQFVMSDAASPTIVRDSADRERALRADADAGLSDRVGRADARPGG